MENIKEKVEQKEQFVEMDGMGRWKVPTQQIIIDEEGTLKDVDFVIVKPQNHQLYTRAYLKLGTSNDFYEFASLLLPKMINSPAEARKVSFFDYDPEALAEMCALIIDIMGKSTENIKRKLNMTLR